MEAIFIDIVLCAVVYGILLLFIIISNNRKGGNEGSDGNDDGGLPVSLPPDIDLPPGVCLPDDPKKHQLIETEELCA